MPKVSAKFPKIVGINRPNVFMKQIMGVLIVILVVFSAVYAVKMFGWNPMREGFEEQPAAPKFKVILVYSENCGHCVKFKPKFDAVSKTSFDVDVVFDKVPVENAQKYAQYVSSGVPAVLVEKDGQIDPSKTMVGNMEERVFKEKLAALLH